MEKLLLRTKLVIEESEQHLQETGCFGTSIESYLTQHILVVMCAEIQQEILKIVENKSLSLSPDLQEFVSTAAKRILRSVHKTEIAGFVGFFGQSVKEEFNRLIDEGDVRIYGNAVSGRHDVAHEYGSSITFTEIKGAYEAARKILNCAAISIGS